MLIVLAAGFAIFCAGSAWRVVTVMRMPRPLRWELHPIPQGPAGKLVFILKEVVLLRSVWEGFRELWFWSWLMHLAFYLFIAATVVSLYRQGAGQTLYFASTICGLAGTNGLLSLRATNERLRPITSRATIFHLLLLALIFGTGLLAIGGGESLSGYLARPSGASLVLQIHLGLLAFFMAYMPFTHMAHMYMKYFTWHEVRWDEGGQHDPANLRRPVSWEATHIAGGRATTWSEVAADVSLGSKPRA